MVCSLEMQICSFQHSSKSIVHMNIVQVLIVLEVRIVQHTLNKGQGVITKYNSYNTVLVRYDTIQFVYQTDILSIFQQA